MTPRSVSPQGRHGGGDLAKCEMCGLGGADGAVVSGAMVPLRSGRSSDGPKEGVEARFRAPGQLRAAPGTGGAQQLRPGSE